MYTIYLRNHRNVFKVASLQDSKKTLFNSPSKKYIFFCNILTHKWITDKLNINGKNSTYPSKSVIYQIARSASTIINQLLDHIEQKEPRQGNKVTVVGVGQVGMAAAISILAQQVTSELFLIDSDEDKLKGEMLDLQHGSNYLRNARIYACQDYANSSGSKVCIVTAGVRQREGESRLALVQRNTDVMKNIIPMLVKYSPDTILLMASNPVDIMTYVAWKLSGLPKTRVIGTGTNLDSSRFRFLLSEKIGIAPTSCHGFIIGEHGDSSVPVWSGLNIAGVRMTDLNPKMGKKDDKEEWYKLHEKVVKGAYEIISLKGYTCWAIGLSISSLTHALLNNSHSVHAISTYVKGQHGIKEEVCLSLPCVLGNTGVCDIVRQPLTDDEKKMLQKSARLMAEVQAGIKM